VSSQKIRAVIFDIGRVLIRVDVASAMSGLGSDPSLSPAETWAALEKDPRWPDWQEGRVSPRDWHLHVAKRLGTSLTFEQFTEAWNRALDPKPLQDISLFEKLAKDYRLALLSNTDPIHVAHMEPNYDFFRFFSRRIYSCGVGASKPNPLIYREALRACKVQAGEAVYTDDILAYVEAAQRLGMAGIHYLSPDQLVQDLAKVGVNVG
jgi:glucose-1-phosphatase